MKCYLCLGTELIVCSRLLSCFFPAPPSAQTVLVSNRKVTDVGPALWAGLHQGLDQLLYFTCADCKVCTASIYLIEVQVDHILPNCLGKCSCLGIGVILLRQAHSKCKHTPGDGR